MEIAFCVLVKVLILPKCMVCSSKTLATHQIGQFGTWTRVRNLDSLIMLFFISAMKL